MNAKIIEPIAELLRDLRLKSVSVRGFLESLTGPRNPEDIEVVGQDGPVGSVAPDKLALLGELVWGIHDVYRAGNDYYAQVSKDMDLTGFSPGDIRGFELNLSVSLLESGSVHWSLTHRVLAWQEIARPMSGIARPSRMAQ